MRRRIAIVCLVVGLFGVGADLWVRKTYGVFLPWQIPERIDVCGRRYHHGAEALPHSADTVVIRVEATFFSLPIPLPDLHETNSSLPYAGCPFQVYLVLDDRVVPYGPPEGGP